MVFDEVARWAAERDLEAIPLSTGDGVLVPVDGETAAWTTQISLAGRWLVLQGMVDLDVDPSDLTAVLRYAAMVNEVDPIGTLTVDVNAGAVGTRVAAVLPTDGDGLPSLLDAAWEASVRFTDRWVPGARDAASGVDPEAAFRRVTGLLGGVQ